MYIRSIIFILNNKILAISVIILGSNVWYDKRQTINQDAR